MLSSLIKRLDTVPSPGKIRPGRSAVGLSVKHDGFGLPEVITGEHPACANIDIMLLILEAELFPGFIT
jgi:hypothetical protein